MNNDMPAYTATTPPPNKRAAQPTSLQTNENNLQSNADGHDNTGARFHCNNNHEDNHCIQEPPQYRRRLISVFSSNQAIHKLTEKIVRTASSLGDNPNDGSMRPGSDPDLIPQGQEQRTRKDSEEVQVTESSLINPFVDYPHLRHFCGVYKFTEVPQRFCEKCFCKVCNVPAKECTEWEDHCHACDTPEWDLKKRQMMERKNNVIVLVDDDDDNDSGMDVVDENDTDNVDRNVSMSHRETRSKSSEQIILDDNDPGAGDTYDENDDNYDDFINDYSHHFDDLNDTELIGQKNRKDARITDVLLHNLRQLSKLSIAQASNEQRNGNVDASQIQKMQGDIPQLNLQSSFFVEGVRIGWPYPAIMPPQRQMAMHLIKAFKNKRHVVIESPTGTGKSAAILCSALAWQRYDAKTNDFGETTQIIYCSRTHSQVAQMVASLRKTPYRPRMAILGSRDRLCIHREIRPRNGVDSVNDKMKFRENINTACQIRVGNTEAYRKYAMNSKEVDYDDDNPPTQHPGDDGGGDNRVVGDDVGGNDDMDNSDEDDGHREVSTNWVGSNKAKMCPHYRQLTSGNMAKKVFETFLPNRQKVNCCSNGGDKTKFGTHDIEDLVKFGVLPNIKRGIALYRETPTSSFGLKLKQVKGEKGPISVKTVTPEGPAASEGTIKEGDTIISINNLDISSGYDISDVSTKIRDVKNPLLLDVYSGTGDDIDENEYSAESVCPYYLSRALAKDADLVFCPYNYILDPNIRKNLEIDINNSVVILDEAHNVEDALRQEGSGTFSEIELLEMNVLLSSHAARWTPRGQQSPFGKRKESLHDLIPDIAHDILVFLDKVIDVLREFRQMFENDEGKIGVTTVTEEYRKFKTPDDKEFEVSYFGPTGHGDGENPIGCKDFFSRIHFNQKEADHIANQINRFQEYMFSKRSDARSQTKNKLADRLSYLLTTLCAAFKSPEHYYISTAICANGNLDFSTGIMEFNQSRYKRKPKPVPTNPPKTTENPNPQPRICNHPICNISSKGTISHDKYCDGSTPRWESRLIINLLTPAILMAPILEKSRTVVLASGSLAPIESLCSELHLLPPSVDPKQVSQSSDEATNEEVEAADPLSSTSGRLQVTPRPLEANHVIDLPKQLLAVSIGHFPDGSNLSVTYANYSRSGFHFKLGQAISTVVESIPYGGVLIFFPSFSFLRKCVSAWQNSETWQRLLRSKGEIVVEPSSSQEEFEEARDLFNGTIEKTGKCVLLAVFRGKMSEGVSFNDNYARGVICIGLPFPSSYDRSISAKMSYNNEQRKFRSKGLLSGNDWYNQQAYRAVAQAIGRCIRHAADYGTIILLDSRHCDDGHSYDQSGICRAHANLPKWMRHSVRTLRRDMRQIGRNDILGGWDNLQKEMKIFFQKAGVHVASVVEQQKNDLKRKQESASQLSQDLSFDHKSGHWSCSQTSPSLE